MTDVKKTRAPKKMNAEDIMKQFGLQTLHDKLQILQHIQNDIAKEKAGLEEAIKLIGNKA